MHTPLRSILVASALSAGCYAAGAGAAPRVQTGPDAEVTADGLTRVDRSTMDMAWVKADLDLRPYDKLMLAGAEIQYRLVDDNGRHYRPGRDDQTEFPISDEGKAMLKEIFAEQFREELAKSERYELVTAPGPGTLLLVGTLIDVVSMTPPDDAPGRYEVYLSEVGEATLILELRDSVTNEVLARAADRRVAESMPGAISVNTVTVWSEVRRLARAWAIQLRKRLDDVTTVAEM